MLELRFFMACFGAILEYQKCSELLFVLNVHTLRSEDGRFTALAAKLKTLIFNIIDNTIMTSTKK